MFIDCWWFMVDQQWVEREVMMFTDGCCWLMLEMFASDWFQFPGGMICPMEGIKNLSGSRMFFQRFWKWRKSMKAPKPFFQTRTEGRHLQCFSQLPSLKLQVISNKAFGNVESCFPVNPPKNNALKESWYKKNMSSPHKFFFTASGPQHAYNGLLRVAEMFKNLLGQLTPWLSSLQVG